MKPADNQVETVLHVVNLAPKDAFVLQQVVALFTDPGHADALQQLRRGITCLSLGPEGNLLIQPTGAMPVQSQRN